MTASTPDAEQSATQDPSAMTPTAAAWQALQAAIAGGVILPAAPDYESVRKPAMARFENIRPAATNMTTIIVPTLSTQRLTLRGFTAADLDALAPIYADPEVSRYLGDGTPADRAATWRALAGMLGHWQLRGYGMWALIEQATGRLIGRAGLYNPEGWPGLEAGWLLARDRWGRGFATEAGRAVLTYGFTHLSADHVISLIHPANTASIRVAERLGERLERELDLKGQRALVCGINRQRWRHGRQEQTRSI
jgi:RimJ/RimL family protein N-acetyltransferase